jgi:cysteine synthase A
MDKPYSQTILLTGGVLLGITATLTAQKLLSSTSTTTTTTPDRCRRRSSFFIAKQPTEDIRNGLEECIGNTPLIRIKSLSELTGCEILGKAEVP